MKRFLKKEIQYQFMECIIAKSFWTKILHTTPLIGAGFLANGGCIEDKKKKKKMGGFWFL